MVARLFSPYMISHIDNAGTYRRKEQERQVLHDFLGPVAVMDVLRGAEPKHKSGAEAVHGNTHCVDSQVPLTRSTTATRLMTDGYRVTACTAPDHTSNTHTTHINEPAHGMEAETK